MELYSNVNRAYLVNYTVRDTNTQKYHLIDVRTEYSLLGKDEDIQLVTPNRDVKIISREDIKNVGYIHFHIPLFIQEIENTTADNIIITNLQKLNL